MYTTEEDARAASATRSPRSPPLLHPENPLQAVVALSWKVNGGSAGNSGGGVGGGKTAVRIEGLAVNPEAAATPAAQSTATARAVEDVIRAASEYLRLNKACTTIHYSGWVDLDVDVRNGAPLASIANCPVKNQGQAVLAGLKAAGFVPSAGEMEGEGSGELPPDDANLGIQDIMYGRPLSPSTAPTDCTSTRPLHEGYTVVDTDAKGDAAGTAWVAWKDACFPEPGCDDAAFTVENMYTGRIDYATGELLRVAPVSNLNPNPNNPSNTKSTDPNPSDSGSSSGGGGGGGGRQQHAGLGEPALAAAGAGVAHAFQLQLGAGAGDAGATVKTCYLDWIGVLSPHRGKGLGRFISTSCLQHLAARGEDYCTLWTQPSRKAAIKLYESLGFVKLGIHITLSLQLVSP